MHRKSILIIEDDEDIRETLKIAIELEEYHVFTAANGREGLEIIQKMPSPCLILVDLMMPVMDGWEFVRAIEEDQMLEDIPIVIVSAYSNKLKTLPGKQVLKKPVDLETLLEVIHFYCNSSETSR